jgi:hypothetical protein
MAHTFAESLPSPSFNGSFACQRVQPVALATLTPSGLAAFGSRGRLLTGTGGTSFVVLGNEKK